MTRERRGAWSPTLSLLPPELLDCDRCGNGCKGGFVWDAFLTVLNNSECPASPGSCGLGDVQEPWLHPGLAYLQVAWPVKRTTHSGGMPNPTGARPRSPRWPGSISLVSGAISTQIVICVDYTVRRLHSVACEVTLCCSWTLALAQHVLPVPLLRDSPPPMCTRRVGPGCVLRPALPFLSVPSESIVSY